MQVLSSAQDEIVDEPCWVSQGGGGGAYSEAIYRTTEIYKRRKLQQERFN